MGEVGWSAGSAKLGAARVAANLFAVQFDRDMQFPTARGACSDKANGSCHRFASLFARKSCLPENPVCPKILKGETWSLPPSRELIIVAYSSSVNILTWFLFPVCRVKLHGWGVGEQGKPGGKMDGGTGRGT